jgi:hypothetical protein
MFKKISKAKITAPNDDVELVLLCQKYASKWVFYSCFMALNEEKFLGKDLFDSLNRLYMQWHFSKKTGKICGKYIDI